LEHGGVEKGIDGEKFVGVGDEGDEGQIRLYMRFWWRRLPRTSTDAFSEHNCAPQYIILRLRAMCRSILHIQIILAYHLGEIILANAPPYVLWM
jgi:hypothetical protein